MSKSSKARGIIYRDCQKLYENMKENIESQTQNIRTGNIDEMIEKEIYRNILK